MRDRIRRTIDVTTIEMTAGGDFAAPPVASAWPLRLALGATVVAVVAGALIVAAIFLWVASVLLPVALIAAAVAYVALRLQGWQRGRSRQ